MSDHFCMSGANAGSAKAVAALQFVRRTVRRAQEVRDQAASGDGTARAAG
jgi:hypothetical protein